MENSSIFHFSHDASIGNIIFTEWFLFMVYVGSLVYLFYEMYMEANNRHLPPLSCWELMKEVFQMMFALKVAVKLWVFSFIFLHTAFSSVETYFNGDQVNEKYKEYSFHLLNALKLSLSLGVALIPAVAALQVRYWSNNDAQRDLEMLVQSMAFHSGELGSESYFLDRPPFWDDAEELKPGRLQRSTSYFELNLSGLRRRRLSL